MNVQLIGATLVGSRHSNEYHLRRYHTHNKGRMNVQLIGTILEGPMNVQLIGATLVGLMNAWLIDTTLVGSRHSNEWQAI